MVRVAGPQTKEDMFIQLYIFRALRSRAKLYPLNEL